jgi:uncharacterized membrane protein YfcA
MMPLVGGIALIVSFMAGMLGLGGAVLLIPAFLYLPPLFGVDGLDPKSITGMTSVQVFASSLLSMVIHRKKGAVDRDLVMTIGLPIMIASFSGAYLSGMIDADIILGIFATMAIIGVGLMMVQRAREETPGGRVDFNRPLAVAIAIGVGLFGSMAGAPGAFILSPLMMTVLKIPTRITIGSTLGIVLMSSLAASVGKFISGQVPVEATVIAVLASLPGAYLGSRLSHRLHTRTLRVVLAVLIGGVGIQMWYQLLTGN